MHRKILCLLLIASDLTIFSYNPEHAKLLENAHLTGKVSCKNCDFSGINLQGYILPNCDLEESDFSGANLSGTQFPNSNFARANLQGTIFSDTILDNCNFAGVSAHGAKFVNSHLHYADFTHAILAQADFTYATLHFTNFTRAHFENSFFSHADLFGAILTDSTGNINTDDRTSFCCTTLPDKSLRSEPNGLCTLTQMDYCKHRDRA